MAERDVPGVPGWGNSVHESEPVRRLALSVGDPDPPKTRSLFRQLRITVVASIVLAVIPVLLFGILTVSEVDSLTTSREQTLIFRAIEDEKERVALEQEGVTVWDEAVLATHGGDRAWMEENAGIWLYEFYSHDQTLVIDAADQPIHAMADGRTVSPTAFVAEAPGVLPLVDELRAELPTAETPGRLGVFDILEIGGRPVIVSAKPIVPDTDGLAFVPEQTYIHVSLRYLSSVLPRISERNLVGGLDFVELGKPLPRGASMPLVSAHEGVIGHVVWRPERPGLAVMRRVSPVVLASALLLVGLIAWLVSRLRRAFSQVHASNAEVQKLALHDTLTGLANRACFDERLDQAMALVRRGETRVAVHYIDLDRFKNINDTLGHPAGDELIRQVAQRLSAVIRNADTVARLGGDEFAILQTGVRDWNSSTWLAERVLEVICQPFTLFSDQAFVGASVGVAMAPDCATDGRELMRKADIALYRAKGSGKGRVCLFEESFDDIVRHKRMVEGDLREALRGGPGLGLAYQPFYATDGRTVRGAEALFRWNHPVRGAMSPLALIEIAQERGLAADLGEWILREACRTARQVGLPFLSINISSLQIQDQTFPDLVLRVLEEVGYPASALQFEVKESTLLENGESITPTLDRLRDAGIRISLDDFGSGYSSFRYLHRMRVDGIKIDSAFVQNMGNDSGTEAMVRVMLDLAAAFGISVVAEGVETDGQWKRLARLGSPDLQGFLFSRPLAAVDLAAVLKDSACGAPKGTRRSA
jgi:diguanylate cyclase (GGDEF)-like protein